MCLARPGSPIHGLLQDKNIYESDGFWVDAHNWESILESIKAEKTDLVGQKLNSKLVDMFPQ